MNLALPSSALRLLGLAALLATTTLPCCAADLLDAWRLARAADPVLAAAEAQARDVHEGVAQARAPLWPQLSASVTADALRDRINDPGGDTLRSTTPQASLTQTLVDVQQWRRVDTAQALDQAQQARLQAAGQALMVRVAETYFGVLSAADTLQTTRANEAAYGQQARQAADRYAQGLAAQVNVQQAQSYAASAQAATLAAERALHDAEDALTEVTGRRLESLKVLQPALPLQPPQPADPAEWVAQALLASPLLAAQRLAVAAGESDIRAARAGHLPTLAAGVDVGRPTQREAGVNRSGTVSALTLQLRIPLFAGGATQSALRQAVARRDVAADDLEATRRRVERDTLAQHRSALSAIGEVRAGQLALDSARRAYEATRVGHELGTQTMTDLLLAIQTLGAAQQQLSDARHRYVLAQLRLRQAAGRLGEDDLAAVNTLLQ